MRLLIITMLGVGERLEANVNTLEKDLSHKAALSEAELSFVKMVLYGTAAVSLAIIISFLSLSSLSEPLKISLGCLTVSLPLSISIAFGLDPTYKRHIKNHGNLVLIALYVSCLLSFYAAIGSLLWHFSLTYMYIFIATTFVGPALIQIGERWSLSR